MSASKLANGKLFMPDFHQVESPVHFTGFIPSLYRAYDEQFGYAKSESCCSWHIPEELSAILTPLLLTYPSSLAYSPRFLV
jgi:hypothetical protein